MSLIVQITDPHLRSDGADPCHDPAQAMQRAFAAISAMDIRPDAIVLSGDIIDRSARDYAHALPLLRQAPVRLLPMPGNHDRMVEFRAAFGGWAPYVPDHLSFVEPVGEVLLIGLDSNLPGGGGGVDEARLDWLSAVLAEARAPVLLALHHPPFPTHAPHLDASGFAGADALASCLSGSRVCKIIAGHSHRGMQTLWAGLPASTCTAIGHGLSLSLSGKTPHRPVGTGPGYELHQLRSGALVSHQVALG
ncbi:metallophosphoesterase [Roseicyclus mahoneyensis]|jgi:3',5'-cyclic-AMP phosphodiesterase|uniref:Calcineurin-like phosphoesterase family protein n=1 Tax=Roseicyclus mahoneyensis TaxID=164332 RepID=A0A316GF94_9RHOB|nr:metallophosphoesterase [Roseicyclus mahoneyensis]PWK59601.1 calcineurin-like phosphoesterase family protein [Roseicyclus mahoneyensis]